MLKKTKSDFTTSTRKNIRFQDQLLEDISNARGEFSFSQWVQDAAQEKLNRDDKSPTRALKSNRLKTPKMPTNINEKIFDAIKLLKSDGKSARMIAKEIDISRGSVDRALKFDNYPK